MSSSFGRNLRFTIFGQSHSGGIGVAIEGLPPGFTIDMDELQSFLDRRAPGSSALTTSRKEADRPEFLSGLVENTTCGAPLTAIIRNTNTRSGDYDNLRDCPRPSHADYCANVKYGGAQDVAGGGHFSGRLTASLCIVGGIAMQYLKKLGIETGAHIVRIGNVTDEFFDPVNVGPEAFELLRKKQLAVINDAAAEEMEKEILSAKEAGDSVGGVIECACTGVPCGIGDPMFDGMENRIAQAVFGIPAVKGIEFGAGFRAGEMRGSQHNDFFRTSGGKVYTETNNHGGILGGITSGMPIIFRAAVKPTPSISLQQKSISLSAKENKDLTIAGRHDPCIVTRAVPVMEAAMAVAVFDALLEQKTLEWR